MNRVSFRLFMGIWHQLWESMSNGEMHPEAAGSLLYAITRPEARITETDMLDDMRQRMGDWAPTIEPVKYFKLVTVELEGQRIAELVDLRAEPGWEPGNLTPEAMTVFMRAMVESCEHAGGRLQRLGPGEVVVGGPGAVGLAEMFKDELVGDQVVEDFRKDIDATFPTYQPGGGDHDPQ